MNSTPRVRWDRVGRLALLAVLLLLVVLYVNPLRTWVSTWQEAGDQRERVEELRSANERLRQRRDALRDPRTLEREARELGMVRPGERAYVVEGLPKE